MDMAEIKRWAQMLDEAMARELVLQAELDRVRNVAQAALLKLELLQHSESTTKIRALRLVA